MRPVKKPVEGRGILASNRMPPRYPRWRDRAATKQGASSGQSDQPAPVVAAKAARHGNRTTHSSRRCRHVPHVSRKISPTVTLTGHYDPLPKAVVATATPQSLLKTLTLCAEVLQCCTVMAPPGSPHHSWRRKEKTNGFRDLSTCMVDGERRYRLPYYLTSDRDARLGQVRVWRENAPEYSHPSWIQNGRSPILDPVISASAAQ